MGKQIKTVSDGIQETITLHKHKIRDIKSPLHPALPITLTRRRQLTITNRTLIPPKPKAREQNSKQSLSKTQIFIITTKRSIPWRIT